jgi:dTDP-4-dehydrorhamnose 3,5-epimerase-like enzyme
MNEINELGTPYVIEGGLGVDDRGEIGFVNDFNFDGVKRFYTVLNHRAGFVRAWHAHRREAKYVTVVRGDAIVAAVAIDNWEHPSKNAQVYRYVLSAKKPSIVHIPPGYANGFMSLRTDTMLVFFSTFSLDETRGDEVRFDARYWDPWQVVER